MDLTPPPIGGDRNRGPELLAVIWVFTIVALLTVGLKIYTRIKILRETGLDDLLIFFSTVSRTRLISGKKAVSGN